MRAPFAAKVAPMDIFLGTIATILTGVAVYRYLIDPQH